MTHLFGFVISKPLLCIHHYSPDRLFGIVHKTMWLQDHVPPVQTSQLTFGAFLASSLVNAYVYTTTHDDRLPRAGGAGAAHGEAGGGKEGVDLKVERRKHLHADTHSCSSVFVRVARWSAASSSEAAADTRRDEVMEHIIRDSPSLSMMVLFHFKGTSKLPRGPPPPQIG